MSDKKPSGRTEARPGQKDRAGKVEPGAAQSKPEKQDAVPDNGTHPHTMQHLKGSSPAS